MTGMCVIALFVLAVAAFLRLLLLFPVWLPKVAAARQRVVDWSWFLFLTGFILLFMFNFWIWKPVGHG